MTDYLDPGFLKSHWQAIIDFYHPACLDHEHGGYICEFRDDQSVLDRDAKHIVWITRYIYTYCLAAGMLDQPQYLAAAQQGLDYLETYQKRPEGGYAWIMNRRSVLDGAKRCYGHAFVLLAYCGAHKAGLPGMRAKIAAAYDLLDQRFYRSHDGLYVDEYNDDWSELSAYRGQNCNMHITEAMLSAYEATGEVRYLDRAGIVASRLARDLSAHTQGLIWEHYTPAWEQDWEYHQDKPLDFWRPYGYTVGHQTEWSKLLLILERYRPEPWLLPQAERLFNTAMARAWDTAQGGLIFTFGPDGRPIDCNRFHWVFNETLAAAALLWLRTGKTQYLDWYRQLWVWCDEHFVDHDRGGWYRNLHPNNQRYDYRSEPLARDQYHPAAMCYEILRGLQARPLPAERDEAALKRLAGTALAG